MENGDPIIEVIKEITSEQVLLYAEASGDFNPIHVDKEFAENSQFLDVFGSISPIIHTI